MGAQARWLCVRIEREQLLRLGDAAQRVAPHRNQAASYALDVGKRRGGQNGLIDRTAHRRNAACLVHGRANDGKVQPLAATDIAVENFADMQTTLHLGYPSAVGLPAPIPISAAP